MTKTERLTELFREHGCKLTYTQANKILPDHVSRTTFLRVRNELFGNGHELRRINREREEEHERMLVTLDTLEDLTVIAERIGGWKRLKDLVNAVDDIEMKKGD